MSNFRKKSKPSAYKKRFANSANVTKKINKVNTNQRGGIKL